MVDHKPSFDERKTNIWSTLAACGRHSNCLKACLVRHVSYKSAAERALGISAHCFVRHVFFDVIEEVIVESSQVNMALLGSLLQDGPAYLNLSVSGPTIAIILDFPSKGVCRISESRMIISSLHRLRAWHTIGIVRCPSSRVSVTRSDDNG